MSRMRHPNDYPFGKTVRFSAVFTQLGVPADPVDVDFVLQVGSGAPQTETYSSGGIIRDGVGLYHVDLVPNASGFGSYNFKGTGGPQTTDFDVQIIVTPNLFGS